MNIPIYKDEIEAGIDEQIKASASIAFFSQLNGIEPNQKDLDNAKKIVKASELFAQAESNQDQIDLYYINSILVSTGWNRNDDVFEKEQTWAARNTPEDKPFNLMHNEKEIIGHITGSTVIDKQGKDLTLEEMYPEEDFDIVTSAVIYKSWTDPETRDRINEIISEIEAGEWFVSMECLFNDFDYAVSRQDDPSFSKVIARDEESAFLTKHLRAYGGNGEYKGHKLGRMLRNISFSGKGLVRKPANPRSVILNTKPFLSTEKVQATVYFTETNNMSENVFEAQIEELKSQLTEAKANEAALRDEVSKQKDEEIRAKVEAFEAIIAEKEEAITEAEAKVQETEAKAQELETTLAETQEKLDEATAAVEAQKAEAKLAARKAALIEVGVSEEEVEETLATFEDASDEMFEQILSFRSEAKPTQMPKGKVDEKEEEDEMKAKSKPEKEAKAKPEGKLKPVKAGEDEEEVAEEEVDEAEAGEEVLEDFEEEAEATLADAGDDVIEEMKSVASEWLEENVLRSTSNIK